MSASKPHRKLLGVLMAFVVALSLALAACGGSSGSSSESGSSEAGSTESESTEASSSEGGNNEPVKVVLSNNYMGNEWRPQMVNVAKYVAENMENVDLEVKIAEGNPSAQISSLQGILREEPDAIIIDASSATALNPTVEQACSQGVVVVSFDQEVTAPCAYKVPENYQAQATDMFNWASAVMKGKGEMLIDEGLAGAPLSEQFVEVWTKMADETPGIDIVGSFSSEFANGPEEQGVTAQLAQHPNASAVLSDYDCAPIVDAYKKAGKTPVAASCVSSNSGAIACEDAKVACFYYGAPAWVGAFALEQAVETVRGNVEPENKEYYFETNFVSKAGEVEFTSEQEVEPLKKGYTYLPEESPALITPITFGEWEITPEIALGE